MIKMFPPKHWLRKRHAGTFARRISKNSNILAWSENIKRGGVRFKKKILFYAVSPIYENYLSILSMVGVSEARSIYKPSKLLKGF